MTGSFDETVALLERCYALTTTECPNSEKKFEKIDRGPAWQRMIDEVTAEVLANDGVETELDLYLKSQK